MDDKRENSSITYFNQIKLMMHGFGDSNKPNDSTVTLVESIVLEQLRLIVQEAAKYAESKTISGEHLVFLMRKSKYKMQRFLKYLHNKELKKNVESETFNIDKLKRNQLMKFIDFIDETGELTDLTAFDEAKHERMLRAERLSIALEEQNYIKFHKARCTSFKSGDIYCDLKTLCKWVDPSKQLEFNNSALDVLSYYAYETVAQIVDYAFLVRLDHQRTSDPLKNLEGNYYAGAMFNGDFRFVRREFGQPNYCSVNKGQLPLSVAEVKEVMRRVFMVPTEKILFGKLSPSQYILAI